MVRTRPITALTAVLICTIASALPREDAYRPKVMPDRIVLTWSGDPTVSQSVTWRTDTSVKKVFAQITEADPGVKLAQKAAIVDATTSELATKTWAANYHSATFRDLKPDTLYAYRVGDKINWSEWLQFRTASSKPGVFSFLYFGDVQNGIRSLASRVIREAIRAAPDARFMAFGGDLVNNGDDDLLWGELFDAGGWLFGMIPMIPVLGNHEYFRSGLGFKLTKHWRSQFTLPENGPKGLEEYAYYTDYQGVRIIALNSSMKVGKQAAWLREVLANNPNRWTIAIFHHPVFSANRGQNEEIRREWKPIFDKYKVDLVLTGHDHAYGRSSLQGATVYVTSVCGSKMYKLDKQAWMKRVAENTQLFQVISIDGDKLSYEARTATGVLYDAFELQKQSGVVNRLVDLIPADVPERK
jgi:3',5'-cyclic AMP phosphodiesterase CpdA